MYRRAPEKVWPEPETNDVAAKRRAVAAAGPISSNRSSVINRKLRELGYRKERQIEGWRIVTVISEPFRFVEANDRPLSDFIYNPESCHTHP